MLYLYLNEDGISKFQIKHILTKPKKLGNINVIYKALRRIAFFKKCNILSILIYCTIYSRNISDVEAVYGSFNTE